MGEWNGWWQKSENSRFWSTLAIFDPLGPPCGPLGAPTHHFESLPYSLLKYFQNETSPRLLAQSVQGFLRKQGELSNRGFFFGHSLPSYEKLRCAWRFRQIINF